MLTTLQGDCRTILPTLDAESVHACITSPPYWALRSYGTGTWQGGDPACTHTNVRRGHEPAEKQSTSAGTSRDKISSVCRLCGAVLVSQEIGQEKSPDEYIAALVEVFRGVRRVLRGDGVCLVNLGDSYNGHGPSSRNQDRVDGGKRRLHDQAPYSPRIDAPGYKEKDLLLLPFRVALALQADGWYVRSVFPWIKANCMPESVTDRPTTAHEYWFLLAKSPRYFWDAEAVRRSNSPTSAGNRRAFRGNGAYTNNNSFYNSRVKENEVKGNDGEHHGRSFRTSDPWRTSLDLAIEETRAYLAHLEAIRERGGLLLDEDGDPLALQVTTSGYAGAHYATFPPKLIEPLLLASVPRECCSVCGAAWVRRVERTDDVDESAKGSRFDQGKTGTNGSGRVQIGERFVKRAIGFAPSCPHADAPTMPGVVLDPFAGSGTTGAVALRHGRRAVLIELNAGYIADHIEERTNGVQITLPLE